MRADRRHRRSSIVVGLLAIIALVPIPALAAAQAAQATATIFGQASHESGATLPGVAVTLRSPALRVPTMSTVTDERGEYRLTPLPIGVYTAEYELSGFQTLRLADVRIRADSARGRYAGVDSDHAVSPIQMVFN